LKAQGQEIGKSLLEADKVELARQLLDEAKKRNVKFLLPVDHVVAMKPETNAVVQQIGEGQPIPADRMALDIGPKTIELLAKKFRERGRSCGMAYGVSRFPAFQGTFHTIVRARETSSLNNSMVLGPMSSAMRSAGIGCPSPICWTTAFVSGFIATT